MIKTSAMKSKFLCAIAALAFCSASVHAADPIDEKQFQKLMKEIGNAAKQFKKNADTKDASAIEKDASRTAENYRAMATFWKNRKADDAVKWSEDSAHAAQAAAAAAKAGNWDEVKAKWGSVGKNCKSCHETYREKLPDGAYKIK
jgi:cytochrome c556